jgi:parallel beta-helix repeat protein
MRIPLPFFGFCVFLAAFGSQPISAKTIHVPGDQPTIQAAIDVSEPGDRILVAPGTYQERPVLKAGVSLRAAENAAEKTVIDGGGAGGGKSPGVTMAEGSEIEGFTVTNVGFYDEAKWKSHWETRGDEQAHDDIGGLHAPAIAADGVICRIARCIVHHNGDTGIAIRGKDGLSLNPLVLDNICHRNMGGGIGAMGGVGGIIQGNRCFENFYAGIGHSGGARPLVTGNDCYGNIRAGIGVSEGSCPVVRANRCHGNRRAGIGIRTGAETRPVIQENDCFENGMAGIGVEEGAEPVLTGNRCEKNTLAGIGLQGEARALITHNRVLSNAEAGIGLRPGTEAILWKNVCTDNGMVAVGLPESARAVLVDNDLSRSGGGMPPLVAVKGGSDAILARNRLSGGGVAGVLVDGRVILSKNQITGPENSGGQGIWVWKGGTAILDDNTIEGFKKPVSVSEGGTLVNP